MRAGVEILRFIVKGCSPSTVQGLLVTIPHSVCYKIIIINFVVINAYGKNKICQLTYTKRVLFLYTHGHVKSCEIAIRPLPGVGSQMNWTPCRTDTPHNRDPWAETPHIFLLCTF